jgi:hypothetical protein
MTRPIRLVPTYPLDLDEALDEPTDQVASQE